MTASVRQTAPAPRDAGHGRFFAPALVSCCLLLTLPCGAAPADAADPWSEALAAKDFAAIETLLDAGTVDPDLTTTGGKTALMLAAQQGADDTVARLLEAGADPNARNDNGGTPLMYAALGGEPSVARLLIAAGARPELEAKLGWTALGVAAVKGHTGVAETLLAAGADQGSRDAYGWTPLMRAVHSRRPGIVRLLLKAPGADLTVRQESGATALHIAAATGDAGMARMLVEHGADRSALDGRGNTPAAIARESGHMELAAYLEGRKRTARSDGD